MSELELLGYYKTMRQRNIVLDFRGAISQDMLVGMAELIKIKSYREFGKANTVRKLFSVFVEMAQNIALYSAERINVNPNGRGGGTGVGAGIITVTENSNGYTITSGNLVENRAIHGITGHCEKINGMDKDELKQFYKKQLKSDRKKGKTGAGIGLIDIARKTGAPVSYKVTPVDDRNSFIALSAKIREEKTNG